MTTFPNYSTGTVSVAANGTTVTGVSTIWSGVNARPGDILQIGDFQTIISDVTDTTHLVIPPWGGGLQSGAAYVIWQTSPLRFAGGQAMADVSGLVAALNTNGYFVFVDPASTVPDPSLGNDGQYALQTTTGKMWVKSSGTWSLVGTFRGFGTPAPYDNARAYPPFDVATSGGSSYVCILPTTGHAPPNATYWAVLASKGDAGPSYATTSTTSLVTAGSGSKAFSTQAGLAYLAGARARATSAGSGEFMEGVVSAYSGTTLTITMDLNSGTGTHADWNINLAGQRGATGAGDLTSTNNLSDVANVAAARTNLGAAVAASVAPDIRLSLTSGVAVTESDVTGATTIYALARGSNWLPIYDGSNVIPRQFTNNSTIILDAATHLAGEVRDVWAYWTGSAVAFGVGPSWAAGTAGSTTARGTGAGSTEVDFTTVPGLPTNKNAIVVRNNSVNSSSIPANQAILLGTIGIAAVAGTTADSAAFRLLSNLYNAAPRNMSVTESAATWVYSTNAFRQVNANAANQIDTVQCVSGRLVVADTYGNAAHPTAAFNCRVGIGINSASVNSANVSTTPVGAAGFGQTPISSYRGFPGIGRRTFVMLENGLGNSSGTGLAWAGSSVNATLNGWVIN